MEKFQDDNQFHTYFHNNMMWLTVSGGKKVVSLYERQLITIYHIGQL